jgi:2-polyprenyl-3-methyl-5-hydroxy-6-metoxy-1,4-benzoquinol methylase
MTIVQPSIWGSVMEQRILAQHVLDTITTSPQAPAEGQYLTLDQAERIVDETVDCVGRHCDAVAYKYLIGHRRRLAISLTFIPKAERDDASVLDIGCYGYLGFWAWKHLGYRHVEGIELRADIESDKLDRQIKLEGETLEFTVHNFDIASAEWPVVETFDIVLLLETLEHVNSDPMGIMLNVARRMRSDSKLVMSVPNSVSYQTLREFVAGMPPWTYWFFHPDLSHEPRHAFEYTPFILKFLLRASGLDELAFRTICAYSERKDLDDIFEIGEELSIDPRLFGETMLVQARRNPELEIVRYPDCIYSSERYYRSTFPLLEEKRRRAIDGFLDSRRERARTEGELRELEEKSVASECRIRELEARQAAGEKRYRELEKKSVASECRMRELEAEQAARENRCHEFETESQVFRGRIQDQEAQLYEALALCDRYLTRISSWKQLDASRERIHELESRIHELESRIPELESAEEKLQAILRSTSWRVTGPVRRLMVLFPRLRLFIRAGLTPLWRLGRAIARGAR